VARSLPWTRHGRSTDGGEHTALAEAVTSNAVMPPPRGYVEGIPRGGTRANQPGDFGGTTRPEFAGQLYQAYLSCPWSSACVDTVARTITAGGLLLVPDTDDDEGDKPTPAPTRDVLRMQSLLDRVNPREDIRQLYRGLLTDAQVFGDGFWEVVWYAGQPVALYSLDSPTMIPIADEHGTITGYTQVLDTGRTAMFEPHEVIQVSLDSPRGGVYGVGPTQKNLLAITTWIFTEALLKETMRKGNPPRLAVDFPIESADTDAEIWAQKYAVRNLGISNLGTPILSRGGVLMKEMQVDRIAEYLATLANQRDLILSGYGVPPSKVGVIESGNLGGGTGTSQDKALDLSTPIPTPTGWTTMGELAIGDLVIDEAGRPCAVIGTFEVPNAESYRITFSDSTHLDACADHLWVTWTAADRKAYGRNQGTVKTALPADWPNWRSAKGTGPRIRRTAEIVNTLIVGAARNNHSIPVTGALDLPEADLPISPYTLGAWLGDGTSSCGGFTNSYGDEHTIAEIRAEGHGVTERMSYRSKGLCPQYTITGLITFLRANNILNNKHVPAVYFRASVAQRTALLQGLMDTDGGFSSGQQVLFRNTNEALADAVVELARSLGQKPVKAKGRAMLNGVDCGVQFGVTWTPTIQCFRLPRKAAQWQPNSHAMQLLHRTITSAVRIPNRPMRCIRVDSPNAMYLAGDAMIPTHNTFRVNTCGPYDELALEKFNFNLTRVGFGIEGWKLRSGEVDWRDDKVVDDISSQRLRDGRWTLNRSRVAIGEPPVDGGDTPILAERQLLMAWSDLEAYSTALITSLQAASVVPAAPTPVAAVPVAKPSKESLERYALLRGAALKDLTEHAATRTPVTEAVAAVAPAIYLTVDAPITVEAAPAPNITVESGPAAEVHNHFDSPVINVEAAPTPNVTIDAPITVEAAPAPSVTVEPAVVNIAAPITVTAPSVTVEPAVVNVAAPIVNLPAPEAPSKSTATRNSDGSVTVTTEPA
jgi:hypothetical protein